MAVDTIDYTNEGQLSLKDVSFALKYGEVSKSLPCTTDRAYLNITTREDAKFCICLSSDGYQVVGMDHDKVDDNLLSVRSNDSNGDSGDGGGVFETIYSLMESISPSYTAQFSHQLSNKLSELLETSSNTTSNDDG